MKIIEEYLNKLYKNEKNKEILDLKNEMRSHLVESAQEYVNQGLSEEEACKKAIENFDGGEEMQNELNKVIKELSSSLDRYKSITKWVKKIFCVLGVVSLIASGALLYYNKNLEKTRNEIGIEFDNEIRILAKKYDMTEVDEYKDELEKLLNKEKYNSIKAFRLYVVDMEDGNTSTSSKRLNSDTVYEKELKVEDERDNTSYLGYNGKDFLDKNGNIVNPDIFSEYFFYNESNILSKVLVGVGTVLLIGYTVIRSREK